jgi:parallel beta-helix repeat protein
VLGVCVEGEFAEGLIVVYVVIVVLEKREKVLGRLWIGLVGGVSVLLFFVALFGAVLNIPMVKASETIYIKADGSVEGTDKIQRDENIYTFTGNIYDSIMVQRSNIIIDGAEYTLRGKSGQFGFYLVGENNVTIKNTNIEGFDCGFFLEFSLCNTIAGNNIVNNDFGIKLSSSSNNTITTNNVTDNSDGIWLYLSSNNTIGANNITNNSYGGVKLLMSSDSTIDGNTFINNGLYVHGSHRNVVKNNLVNGKSLIYLEKASAYRVSQAGQVVLVECDDISVEGLDLSNTTVGVQLWNTNNTKIFNNNLANNSWGVCLDECSNNNTIAGNNAINNFGGIKLISSSNNTVTENNITKNKYGIYLGSSSNNSVAGNNITNNEDGISLSTSSNNIIVANNVINNSCSVIPMLSSNNIIYHNNFINNTRQVSYKSCNVLDGGYPSGGNYWSSYAGVDANSDGIGDMHYDIDASNTDRYPLMGPISVFDAGTWNGETYSVDIVSNSTLSDFKLNATQKTLIFNVTGIEDKTGFCRVTIPTIIIQDLWQGNYTILLNGEPWSFRNWTDTDNIYIYINYTHLELEQQIIIVPEFPRAIILPLFMIVTLLAVIVYRRKHT